MNSFVGALQTLVTKTMEDTLMTIKGYEKSRLFFLFFIAYYLALDAIVLCLIINFIKDRK